MAPILIGPPPNTRAESPAGTVAGELLGNPFGCPLFQEGTHALGWLGRVDDQIVSPHSPRFPGSTASYDRT